MEIACVFGIEPSKEILLVYYMKNHTWTEMLNKIIIVCFKYIQCKLYLWVNLREK